MRARDGRARRSARRASAATPGSARRSPAASTRPRLAVFRSNRHIYVQLIDDVAAVTIAAASDAEVKGARQDGPRQGGREG